ncbi:MAG: pantoate--beta-alanine ligase, partial [Terriglobales bacterium]
ALVLQRALGKVRLKFQAGERSAAQLISTAKEVFAGQPDVVLDYCEIVDPDTLNPVAQISRKTLVAVAAYVGTTRLIDNLELNP